MPLDAMNYLPDCAKIAINTTTTIVTDTAIRFIFIHKNLTNSVQNAFNFPHYFCLPNASTMKRKLI